MGKIFLNQTGKLALHTFNGQEDRSYLFSFCPQKRIHFNNFNNNINGKYLFYMTSAEEVTGELPFTTDCQSMFYQAKSLKSVKLHTPLLTNMRYMFSYCYKLENVEIDTKNVTNGYSAFRNTSVSDIVNNSKYDFSSLTSGEYMFANCNNIESVTNEFPQLTQGDCMFYTCPNLTTVQTTFPNLQDGYYMFGSCNLSSTPYTPSLISGNFMYHNNKNLTEYTHDLPNMVQAQGMFRGCVNLETFSGSFPSLGTDYDSTSSVFAAQNMFDGCKLNKTSVLHILEQMKSIELSAQMYITIGANIADASDENYKNQLLSYFDPATLSGFSGVNTFRGYVNSASDYQWFVVFQWN